MSPFLSFDAAPDRTAIVRADGSVVLYGDLQALIESAAMDLQREVGAGPGHVLAVGTTDPLATLIAVLAALNVGCAVLPLDMRAGKAHQATWLSKGRPLATITGADAAGRLTFDPATEPPRRVPPETGLLLFTSGSSGEPKGVLLSRSGIQANVTAILSYLPVKQHPRTALVLPLSYSYALVGQAFVTLQAGGQLLLIGEGTFPLQQLALMRQLGASGLSAVPTALRRLCEAAASLPEEDRPPLGYLASAGAPLDPTTRHWLHAAFPAARLFNQYGLTEACPRVTALSDAEAPFAAGSVGRPLPGITLRIVDENGQTLAPGQTGQLVVRGPSVMLGYLDDPQATAAVLQPDGLHAGDLGWLDDDGYLYIAGRKDSLVQCAGERVSIDEVAAVLRLVPGVADAHVVAIPDELFGHRLVAFVETTEAELPQIRQTLRNHLPPAKRPQRLILLPALPRSGNGKVASALLRTQAMEAGGPG
jgi:acyl-CoA synthetase (AMP-forming)/AMP-acid ligase II